MLERARYWSPARLISSSLLACGAGLASSGISAFDDLLGGEGYPAKSAVLVTGPAGIGKEALGYWFTQDGLLRNEFCVYVTRLSMHEVLQDQKAFGIRSAGSPFWVARSGGQLRLDLNDLDGLVRNLSERLALNSSRRIRVVLDVLSPVLMLNPPDDAYRFVDGLLEAVKQHDAILLATLEEGMHSSQTVAAMHQLFDGIIEFRFQRTGLRIGSLLRVVKMRGINLKQEYHLFSLDASGMTLTRVETRDMGEPMAKSTGSGSGKPPSLSTPEASSTFEYLLKSFALDYQSNRLSMEQSGWRSRVAIAEATGIKEESFYGKGGTYGPVLKELLSSGLIEIRFFSGQRGRGGEVAKFRACYEKELVRRLFGKATRVGGEEP